MIGDKIKELRLKKNVSQTDISKSVGASQRTISKWENNKSVPNAVYIKKISDYFGIPVNAFYEDVKLTGEVIKDFVITAINEKLEREKGV